MNIRLSGDFEINSLEDLLIVATRKYLFHAMNINDLINAIKWNAEYLESTEGDTYGCITLENLEGVLTQYFEQPIKLETNED